MGQIKNTNRYGYRTPNGSDYLIGTKKDDFKKTVSFRFSDVAASLGEDLGFSSIKYEFSEDKEATTEEGILNSDSLVGETYEGITKIVINNVDLTGNELQNPLTRILSSKDNVVLYLKDSSVQNNFVFLKILDYVQTVEYSSIDVEVVNNLLLGGFEEGLTYTLGYFVFDSSEQVTNTSELVNDGEDGSDSYVESREISQVGFTNDYEDLDNLPTSLSDFDDDIGATDGIQPLSAVLDIVDGDDSTAELENFNKPFSTLAGLLDALPAYNNETYTIYITGGTVPVTRRMPMRNLTFVAYKTTTLDFGSCMEDDGVTPATYCLIDEGNTDAVYTFTGENINITSEASVSSVNNVFSSNASSASSVVVKGKINTLKWITSHNINNGVFSCNENSDIEFNEVYQANADTLCIRGTGVIDKFYVRSTKEIAFLAYSLTINNIVATDGISRNFKDTAGSGGGFITYLAIGNADPAGTLTLNAKKVEFLESTITNLKLNIASNEVTGSISSIDSQVYSRPYTNNVRFVNYSGQVDLSTCFVNGTYTFENCNISTPTTLAKRNNNGVQNSQIEQCVTFIGVNTIVQGDTSYPLFGEGVSGRPIEILIQGAVYTNAKTFGSNTTYIRETATFKEKLKEIVIRDKRDIVNKELDLDTTYIIDGDIELLTGETIEVPDGGNLTINGYGLEASRISKNVSGESIFSSPVGGSGGLQMQGLSISSGLGSVFDLTDADGTNAIEINVVNLEGCNSLGELNGFRQFLGTTIGIYGCSDGLTLSGTWNGFKITNTNAFGFGSSGVLFKEGTSLEFNNRFYAELNLDLPTGAEISDFQTSNFNDDELFQLNNCIVKLNSTLDKANTEALIPNIYADDNESKWSNNLGIFNSPKSLSIQTGTSYTIDVNDVDDIIIPNNASFTTVTIPTDASEPIPVGESITLINISSTSITIVGSGGVTVDTALGGLTVAQYEKRTLTKIEPDRWIVS